MNQIARVVLVRRDEVLHRRAERRFDRHFVTLFGGNDIGDRALDFRAERRIFLRFDLQRAHAVAVAVETVFESFVKFKVIFEVCDRGIAVDQLFRHFLPRTPQRGDFVCHFLLALRFFVEEFFAVGELFAAFFDLPRVFGLLRPRLFDRLSDFGNAFARGVAPCRKAARLGADIGKVFHRGKFAGALFVEYPFIRNDARIRFRHLFCKCFAFGHDFFGAFLPAFAHFNALFDRLFDFPDTGERILHLFVRRRKLPFLRLNTFADDLRFARLVFHAHLEKAQLFVDGTQLLVGIFRRLAVGGALFLGRLDAFADFFQPLFGFIDLGAVRLRFACKPVVTQQITVHLFVAQFFAQFAVFDRRFRLFFEGAQLMFFFVETL